MLAGHARAVCYGGAGQSLLIAIALPAVVPAAEPAAWHVVSVHDGDTLTALDAANVQHKVRLTGIATTCPHYVAGSFKVVAV